MKRAASALWLNLSLAVSATGATLRPGDVLVANSGVPYEISALDPVTGAKTPICACDRLSTIRDIAVSSSGKLYAAGQVKLPGDVIADGIAEIDPTSGDQRIVASGGFFGFLQGIAVEANGQILVSTTQCVGCGSSAGVIRVDPTSGDQSLLASGPPMINPSGIDAASAGIYVTTQVNTLPTLPSGVVRIHPVTGAQHVVAYGDEPGVDPIDKVEIVSARDVAVDEDGTIYVMDVRFRGDELEDEIRLLRVHPTTGAQTLLTESIVGLDRSEASFSYLGMDVSAGVMFVVAYRISESGQPGVVRFDPAVGAPEELSSEDLFRPRGIAIVEGVPPVQLAVDEPLLATLVALGLAIHRVCRRRRAL